MKFKFLSWFFISGFVSFSLCHQLNAESVNETCVLPTSTTPTSAACLNNTKPATASKGASKVDKTKKPTVSYSSGCSNTSISDQVPNSGANNKAFLVKYTGGCTATITYDRIYKKELNSTNFNACKVNNTTQHKSGTLFKCLASNNNPALKASLNPAFYQPNSSPTVTLSPADKCGSSAAGVFFKQVDGQNMLFSVNNPTLLPSNGCSVTITYFSYYHQ